MTIISVENLKIRAGEKNIVDIDQLKFESPYVYGILGPNGSGKSTLLKAICGVEGSHNGIIEMDDKDVMAQHEYVSSNTGSLIESPTFYPYSTPLEFIGYVSEMRNGKRTREGDTLNEIISMVNLGEKKNQMMKYFSTGELKRIGIAAAIAGDPKCVILDEPTDNIDLIGKDLITGIIKKMKEKGKLVIIASHDVELLQNVCDEIIFLKEGKIAEIVNVKEELVYFIKIKGTFDKSRLDLSDLSVKIEGDQIRFRGDFNQILKRIVNLDLQIEEINLKNVLDQEYRKIFSDEI